MTDNEAFQVLLQWECDGIFPHIYGLGAPAWYEAEKHRRGITVTPVREVSWEEFVERQPE